MRSQELIKKRNVAICEKYAELWGQGIREEIILPKLSEMFYLELKTVYNIVLAEGKKPKVKDCIIEV